MPVPGSDENVCVREGSDFASLILLARQAHHSEVRCLEDEVQSLRKRLTAICGDRQSPCVDMHAKRADSPVDPEPTQMGTEERFPDRKTSADAQSAEDENSAGMFPYDPRFPNPLNSQERDRTASPEEGNTRTIEHGRMSTLVPTLSRREKRVSTWKDLSKILQQSARYKRSHLDSLATQGVLGRLVHDPMFEVFITSAILLNGAVMAAEAQYQGFDLAVWTNHESASRVSADVWPHGETIFEACEWIFGLIFLFEIMLKLVATRIKFFRGCLNCIDLAVVTFWVYGRVSYGGSVNAQMLRIARMARLLRIVRYLNNAAFDSLYIMVTSLRGSMMILAWSFLLLLMFHVVLALVVNQALRLWYFQESQAEEQTEVFVYFGSFSRSLLTMFELTLANWIVPARVLMEKVNEWLLIS
ncbi:unnamed protein product [Prorocentrum cordatum]|uniref:Ion transport domain-containing protein n=1 Tax=Prorocentrum cordatum TaxID=2364126 RepID=A0ABN9WB52_9DINO|nr:unnamed protein product [Polarella glacialis]